MPTIRCVCSGSEVHDANVQEELFVAIEKTARIVIKEMNATQISDGGVEQAEWWKRGDLQCGKGIFGDAASSIKRLAQSSGALDVALDSFRILVSVSENEREKKMQVVKKQKQTRVACGAI